MKILGQHITAGHLVQLSECSPKGLLSIKFGFTSHLYLLFLEANCWFGFWMMFQSMTIIFFKVMYSESHNFKIPSQFFLYPPIEYFQMCWKIRLSCFLGNFHSGCLPTHFEIWYLCYLRHSHEFFKLTPLHKCVKARLQTGMVGAREKKFNLIY